MDPDVRDVSIAELLPWRAIAATFPEGRFKWVSTRGGGLFHLDADPGETRDVADRHPHVSRRLTSLPIELGVPPRDELLRDHRREVQLARARAGPGEREEKELRARLRALGYVDEVEAAEGRD